MFTTRFTKSFAGTTLVAGVLGLAALVGAGTASAAGDTDFIRELEQAGFSGKAQTAIGYGQAVCEALADGATETQVISALANKTGLSAQDAKIFAVIAAKNYCPQYVR